jgi:hypothetical protein
VRAHEYFIAFVFALAVAIGVLLSIFSGHQPAPALEAVEKPAHVPEIGMGVEVMVTATKETGVIVDFLGYPARWSVRFDAGYTPDSRDRYTIVPFFTTELQALPLSK